MRSTSTALSANTVEHSQNVSAQRGLIGSHVFNLHCTVVAAKPAQGAKIRKLACNRHAM